jgi:hypothetical protein
MSTVDEQALRAVACALREIAEAQALQAACRRDFEAAPRGSRERWRLLGEIKDARKLVGDLEQRLTDLRLIWGLPE